MVTLQIQQFIFQQFSHPIKRSPFKSSRIILAKQVYQDMVTIKIQQKIFQQSMYLMKRAFLNLAEQILAKQASHKVPSRTNSSKMCPLRKPSPKIKSHKQYLRQIQMRLAIHKRGQGKSNFINTLSPNWSEKTNSTFLESNSYLKFWDLIIVSA